MKALLAAVTLMLAAAAPAFAQEACSRAATREVRFTGAERAERITARSSGPSCAQAIVVWTLRNAQGDPLFVFASTFSDMSENSGAATPDQMDRFLRAWVGRPIQSTASALPDWPADAYTLSADQSHGMDTPYERETYLALRARNLPLLCFANSAESEQCLIIDPMSHAATVIVFRATPPQRS